ncbi:MAG: ABC transporter substrate-binding protein [Acetobacteraceae bacterium]|nr:ABC transporter substrate-binding protein [Acetobacteraceae bacterium]
MPRISTALALAASLAAAPAAAQQLRVAIQSDPNMLDPAQSGAYVERIVFAALCDKLVDVAPDLSLRPELATRWEWSADAMALTLTLRPDGRFHDGGAIDAQAVAANLERYRAARESRRRAELAAVSAVEVSGPMQVTLRLKQPFAPLVSVLADRAGMMLSPAALAAQGARIHENPVCSGPFRFARRVAQDRIETEKFAGHWNAANIHADRLTFFPIPDNTVRLLNLKAGQLDIIVAIAPNDVPDAMRDRRIRVVDSPSIAFQTMEVNTGHGPRAQGPLGSDPRVRQALELSIDRGIINQVALDGRFIPNNQAEAPGTPYHFPDLVPPARNLERARALLREAGHERLAFTLNVINSPIESQVGQIIQAMAAEAGIEVKLEVLEAAATVAKVERGEFDAFIGIWSGRPDPDGNYSIWFACNGFVNRGKYCNPAVDAALAAGRGVTAVAERQRHYHAAVAQILADRPHLILYHHRWFWGLRAGVSGFEPNPDGIIRWAGIRLP